MLAGNGSELRPFSTTGSITLQENAIIVKAVYIQEYNYASHVNKTIVSFEI
jgi:hypothetical protein